MASFSDYLENKILNHVLKGTTFTAPSKVYVALFTTNPTDAGTGTEVTGGAYARQEVPFSTALTGSTDNSADITFPIATADWGTVSHIGIYDAPTSGNLLFHGALTEAKAVGNSEQFKIATGGLTVSID